MTEPQRLFDEFNRRYWRGRLPRYRVLRVQFLTSHLAGRCNDTRHLISLSRHLTGDDLRRMLLHEMCHIGPRGGGHGHEFQRRLKRLGGLGEPLALVECAAVEAMERERDQMAEELRQRRARGVNGYGLST